MATHSSTLAWRIPWTEEPCRLQSMGSQSQTRPSNRHIKLRRYLMTQVCSSSTLPLLQEAGWGRQHLGGRMAHPHPSIPSGNPGASPVLRARPRRVHAAPPPARASPPPPPPPPPSPPPSCGLRPGSTLRAAADALRTCGQDCRAPV